ncbi:heat-shock protein HslJ [Photobacterium iliopiscarium]|jgi:heat shock protein HslJ|uniref:META domain-containing protein n=1 Tax=Photobacterium iliopiscarium TaxID=56192 RepID=A0A0D8Q2F7_9GAMM|nr:META domain-containing protein [Photobacterium iliopiscarium]KJG24367.1 heat-shock protein HslJ [Photobacterium iliopiscarium]MCD9465920.1 META domain-containing protein [Photobacterium iliopiscarium]MCD9487749.1 META domain-containing protein [Photobacterium iliopiscarium]MCF2244349.1 META domain-containing protein [Photobacterium iliopiscarium]PST95813.1 META domain-containing protein [Photobacterium iliopiscarium]
MKKTLLTTLFIATILTGCANSPENTTDLINTWAVSSIDGYTQPVDALTIKPQLTINKNFNATYSGCNTLTGKIRITTQDITTRNLISTQKMCIQNEQATVDGFVKQMLTGPSDFLVNSNTLILSSDNHTVTFKRVVKK